MVGYSCWAIQQEGSKEIDKTWIDEINKIFLKPQLAEEILNVEEEEIVREAGKSERSPSNIGLRR